jgi:hypothetical protein
MPCGCLVTGDDNCRFCKHDPEDEVRVDTLISDQGTVLYKDGEPCDHKGCRYSIKHDCEGCGRRGCVGEVKLPKHIVDGWDRL